MIKITSGLTHNITNGKYGVNFVTTDSADNEYKVVIGKTDSNHNESGVVYDYYDYANEGWYHFNVTDPVGSVPYKPESEETKLRKELERMNKSYDSVLRLLTEVRDELKNILPKLKSKERKRLLKYYGTRFFNARM